jgi:hypothetical protein
VVRLVGPDRQFMGGSFEFMNDQLLIDARRRNLAVFAAFFVELSFTDEVAKGFAGLQEPVSLVNGHIACSRSVMEFRISPGSCHLNLPRRG